MQNCRIRFGQAQNETAVGYACLYLVGLYWTSSPLVAAFFAVGYGDLERRTDASLDACIWLLNCSNLNSDWYECPVDGVVEIDNPAFSKCVGYAFGEGENMTRVSENECVLLDGSAQHAKAVSKKNEDNRVKQMVVAVVAPQVDARVMAQSGYFTLHGGKEAIETLNRRADYLEKWIIPGGKKVEIARELRQLGIRHANMFPDLANLATDLKEHEKRRVLSKA